MRESIEFLWEKVQTLGQDTDRNGSNIRDFTISMVWLPNYRMFLPSDPLWKMGQGRIRSVIQVALKTDRWRTIDGCLRLLIDETFFTMFLRCAVKLSRAANKIPDLSNTSVHSKAILFIWWLFRWFVFFFANNALCLVQEFHPGIHFA